MGLAGSSSEHQFASVLDCAGNCALKQCELAPEMAWRINVEGVQNLLSQTVPRGVRLVHLSCDLVFSGADGRGGYVETDPTDPVTVYGQTMAAAEEVDPGGRPDGLHPADFAADGRQLQRPRRGDRLDRLAVQEVAARHALFRRNPHAHLHRLPQPAVRADARQRAERHFSRRRAAAAEPLPDRTDHQPRGRIRPGLPDGHSAPRGRPDPAAGRQRVHGLRQADPARWATIRSTPWPYCESLVPTHADWHRERPPGEPRSPAYLHRVLATNPRVQISFRKPARQR